MAATDLAKIKRLILLGRYRFTRPPLHKPFKGGRREKLYIIEGFTFDGLLIYTKGVIRKEFGQETLYILVSAKRST